MLKPEDINKEYDLLLQKLSDHELISDAEKLEELSRKKNKFDKILEKNKEIENIQKMISENQAITTAKEDQDLLKLAEEENIQLKEKEKILQKELTKLLSQKEENSKTGNDIKAVIMEIRAGTGGQESALFATDLYRMYSKYAKNKGWKQKVLDSHPTELGGFKEITFELEGGDVFLKMKDEGGVHRIQRIPATEKSGRVHTSTATVAVLPKPKKTQFKINLADLRVDFYRSSGPGGQYVNKRETAVRITHVPTNMVVTSQTERNQLQNKENSMAIMEAKLLERKEAEEVGKLGDKRKTQIGGAKRSEKIRTYNFPQDRVTDHRIKKSWHNIEGIMDGKLEPIISALQENPESD